MTSASGAIESSDQSTIDAASEARGARRLVKSRAAAIPIAT